MFPMLITTFGRMAGSRLHAISMKPMRNLQGNYESVLNIDAYDQMAGVYDKKLEPQKLTS